MNRKKLTIFSTRSPVEADVVRGLLEANGVMPILSSATSRSLFPFSVSELGEVRIAVHPDEADDARRIIEAHRTELQTGQVVRLRDEFDALPLFDLPSGETIYRVFLLPDGLQCDLSFSPARHFGAAG